MRVLKDGTMPLAPGLPPFAPVSVRLLDILARQDAVVEQVAELLRLDASFVAEVLRPANTPVFGFERQIRSLAHAVARLGTQRLRALIATVGLRQASRSYGAMRGYWRHSVASGFLAAEITGGWGIPDRAYTAGLPHDTGTFCSLAGVPTAQWSVSPDDIPVESLSEVVVAACRLSEALGFALGPSSECGIDEVLQVLPHAAREPLHINASHLARALEEKIAVINN